MILKHLRATTAVAYLALFLALTSTSYAATQLANGSVTKSKLAKNAVSSGKIKDNAVKSADVKNGSLGAEDLAPGTLPEVAHVQVVGNGDDPVAPADVYTLGLMVTLPRAGQVLIRVDLTKLEVDCSTGDSTAGLYVDGDPVPGTAGEVIGALSVSRAGLATLAAGAHELQLGAKCDDDNFSGFAPHAGWWTVQMVGD